MLFANIYNDTRRCLLVAGVAMAVDVLGFWSSAALLFALEALVLLLCLRLAVFAVRAGSMRCVVLFSELSHAKYYVW